ncbi:MAG: RnfH family protein [Gammaproteobacteria bacterium]|nr:RnfH family protein [Gammaproteobacteria bacterium]
MVSESESTAEQVRQIKVEVAFAREDKQQILELMVNQGTTLEQAIEQSGIMTLFPEIDLNVNKVGIFGKLGKKTAELKEGDRVEIYRPLIADPKEVRRKREADGKKMKKGGGEK